MNKCVEHERSMQFSALKKLDCDPVIHNRVPKCANTPSLYLCLPAFLPPCIPVSLVGCTWVDFPYNARARTLNMLPTVATALSAAQLAHMFENGANFLMTTIQNGKRAHPAISAQHPQRSSSFW